MSSVYFYLDVFEEIRDVKPNRNKRIGKMRKAQKEQVENFLKVLGQAHEQVRLMVEKNNFSAALEILQDCQQGAISLGNMIETLEGKDAAVIVILEKYCELVYQIHTKLIRGEAVNRNKTYKLLNSFLLKIENSVKNDIKVRREVVFLPYKASMWDSLESVWKAADKDLDCEAYVIPIPYYDKNPDGSLGRMHYEGNLYPANVPITGYEEYDFRKRNPDVIYIHNPYDGCNRVTSVDPRFYSSELKKFTERLVYVPYFVVPWGIPEHFVLTPGAIFSDLVFVQNQYIRKQYIKILKEKIFLDSPEILEEKIVSIGTPKTDKLLQMQSEKNMPEEWKDKLQGKIAIFFNTNVSLLLKNGEHFIENLNRIFCVFEEYKHRFVLIWREHPLTMETFQSMTPELLDKYLNLREEFVQKEWGILDTTSEPHMAMALSDCYFGAGGSLVAIYSVTGKPMLVTAYDYPEGISEEEISKEKFYQSIGRRSYYKEENANTLRLFLDNYDEIKTFHEQRIEVISKALQNLDGTVGEKIYDYVVNGGKQ